MRDNPKWAALSYDHANLYHAILKINSCTSQSNQSHLATSAPTPTFLFSTNSKTNSLILLNFFPPPPQPPPRGH